MAGVDGSLKHAFFVPNKPNELFIHLMLHLLTNLLTPIFAISFLFIILILVDNFWSLTIYAFSSTHILLLPPPLYSSSPSFGRFPSFLLSVHGSGSF